MAILKTTGSNAGRLNFHFYVAHPLMMGPRFFDPFGLLRTLKSLAACVRLEEKSIEDLSADHWIAQAINCLRDAGEFVV